MTALALVHTPDDVLDARVVETIAVLTGYPGDGGGLGVAEHVAALVRRLQAAEAALATADGLLLVAEHDGRDTDDALREVLEIIAEALGLPARSSPVAIVQTGGALLAEAVRLRDDDAGVRAFLGSWWGQEPPTGKLADLVQWSHERMVDSIDGRRA